MINNHQPNWPRWVYPALLLLFPFIAFWQLGLMQYTMKWDMMDQYFPFRYYISECIQAGEVPLWNPYLQLGYPIHADPQSGFWYPFVWLFSWLRGYDIFMLNFEVCLHFSLAGIGMYLLLRGFNFQRPIALIFAIAYSCCGLFVSNAQHMTYVVAATWIPYVFHFYLQTLRTKRWVYPLATALCMMLLLTGGYPAFTIVTHYYLLVFFLVWLIKYIREKDWSEIKHLVLSNAVIYTAFVLLSMGYIISFLHVYPEFSRGDGVGVEAALHGPFSPRSMISFILPFAVVKKVEFFGADISMLNGYFGLIPLLCLAVGFWLKKPLNIWIFFVLALFSLLAALGEATPLRAWLYHLLPMWDTFRFPSLLRIFFIIGAMVTGAFALQQILKGEKYFRFYFLSGGLLFALAVLLTAALIYGGRIDLPNIFKARAAFAYLEHSHFYTHIATQSLIQMVVLATMIFVFWKYKHTQWFWPALIFAVMLDGLLATQLNMHSTVISGRTTHQYQQNLDTMPDGFPIPDNSLSLYQTTTMDTSLQPGWYNHNIFLKTIGRETFNPFVLKDYGKFYKSQLRDSLFHKPLLYFHADTSRVEMAINTIDLTEFGPNHIKAEVSTPWFADSLTLLQSDYEGWQAYLDGKPVHHNTGSLAFITLQVPQGKHTVEYLYQPAYFQWSATLSIFSLIFVLAGIIVLGYFRR